MVNLSMSLCLYVSCVSTVGRSKSEQQRERALWTDESDDEKVRRTHTSGSEHVRRATAGRNATRLDWHAKPRERESRQGFEWFCLVQVGRQRARRVGGVDPSLQEDGGHPPRNGERRREKEEKRWIARKKKTKTKKRNILVWFLPPCGGHFHFQ